MAFWSNKNIVVTGGSGFLGSFVVEKLREKGVPDEKIIVPRSRNFDLLKFEDCLRAVDGADIVIHLAGKTGGIGLNTETPGAMFFENAIMGIQLIEAARQRSVGKTVILGTVASYPKEAPVPFNEESLWNSYPDDSVAAYGMAKKILLVQSQAYRQQYGSNIIYLLMGNLYGPRDHFGSAHSHVVPALITKFTDAVRNHVSAVELWGTGKPTRGFLYVEDAAKGILLATEKYNKPTPINIAAGYEISIRELANLIAELTGFHGHILWDNTKPNGQLRRCLDISKAKEELGFKAKTPLREGLKKTIEWYLANRKISEEEERKSLS